MAKRRKDQRFAVNEAVERQVFSLLGGEAQVRELLELREALNDRVRQISELLTETGTEFISQSLALKSGRRGDTRFEIDPDGRMVLVVSYGGEVQEPLVRTDMKPAWNKRGESKAKPAPKSKPKKGFVKTSIAVSETKTIPSDMGDIDAILDAFNEDAKAPEDNPTEVHDGYTPATRSKLRRIPNQSVKRGRGNERSLAAIMAMDGTKNGDDL